MVILYFVLTLTRSIVGEDAAAAGAATSWAQLTRATGKKVYIYLTLTLTLTLTLDTYLTAI